MAGESVCLVFPVYLASSVKDLNIFSQTNLIVFLETLEQ